MGFFSDLASGVVAACQIEFKCTQDRLKGMSSYDLMSKYEQTEGKDKWLYGAELKRRGLIDHIR
ncbi:hypothetical protein [Anaerovibrio slackiae]|uniref:hypothetical protein n=1 Tax=Anaerovibrio slackiae TaxID=2652309 RepID=UPI003869DF0A